MKEPATETAPGEKPQPTKPLESPTEYAQRRARENDRRALEEQVQRQGPMR